jgi:hypothetical protein
VSLPDAVDREVVARWVADYERAWRTPGTDRLSELFAPEVTYRPSPWAPPVRGLPALAELWEAERAGPDEVFTLSSEVVAVEGRTAVVRVSVDYAAQRSGRWRDLWVIRLDETGRCTEFEEWPFAPEQQDGP